MNGYSTVKEMAKVWDVSERQVQFWCKSGMIDGAAMFAASWVIPADANTNQTLKPLISTKK